MKAIDTNILLRYLLEDSPKQFELAKNLFKQSRKENKQLFVSSLVVLEIIWVLESIYEMPRLVIIDTLLKAMNFDFLAFEYSDAIKDILVFAKDNTFDLSDLLIGAIAQSNDCETTLTFDQKASKSPYFELLK